MQKVNDKKILLKITLVACLFLNYFFTSALAAEQSATKNTVKPKTIYDLVKDEFTLIKKIQFTSAPNLDEKKIEIVISKSAKFKSFTLSTPDRLVIDIEDTNFEEHHYRPSLPPFISSLRSSVNEVNSLRLVFDFKEKLLIRSSSFKKDANKSSGKISIEISPPSKTPIIKPKSKKIIVIDAGHGGKDPGTIGRYARSKEKNITLSYAKELKKHLEMNENYKVYLTRDHDTFISLTGRVMKARKLKADLFISLHANSINNNKTSGFSIYTLSEKSSDKQAELLARKENRVDIIAGINFSGASKDIMGTLIGLSQRDSMNNSSAFANMTISSVKEADIEILQNTHRFAGFAVLKAPDMAAVLIELGYLSNKYEEKKLNNLIYKRKLCKSLVNAIDQYFAKIKH